MSSNSSHSTDGSPPSPCLCGSEEIIQYQADRIAALDVICQKVMREKANLARRKEEYKASWDFVEGEIARLLDERTDFTHRFNQRATSIHTILQEMGTRQVDSDQVDSPLLEKARARLEAWMLEEQRDRSKWSDLAEEYHLRVSENPDLVKRGQQSDGEE
jgi:hypothetical protein